MTAARAATAAADSTTTTPNRRARGDRLSSTALVYLALAGLFVLGWVLVEARGGTLLSQSNSVSTLRGAAALGIVAAGQTVVILCGSLDLSVAYLISLTSLVAAETMNGKPSMIGPAILLVIGLSVAVGVVNGLIVTKLKVNAFIATLGTALVIRGYLEDNYAGAAGSVPRQFQKLGYDRVGPIPISVLLMLTIAGLVWVLLAKTRAGYHLYAVGGGQDVARLSGVRTDRVVVLAHVVCSVCAGLTGLFLASRLGVGDPRAGTVGAYDLQSIAAVVLGGTALAGGRGGVTGTIGGVFILALLDTIFDELRVDPFWKDAVRGAVIIAAVALYARRRSGARTS